MLGFDGSVEIVDWCVRECTYIRVSDSIALSEMRVGLAGD